MKLTSSTSYTRTAKWLHWLIALAISFMLALGWSFSFLPNGETKFFLFQLHKSIGISILLLSIFRLIWRCLHAVPPLPASVRPWEKAAASVGHFALYFLMIGMPLTGWAMVSASPRNIPTILFGLIFWPPMPIISASANKQQLSHVFSTMHGLAAYILAALIVGHAAAALRHHFISRDDVLLRMAPQACAHFFNRIRNKT